MAWRWGRLPGWSGSCLIAGTAAVATLVTAATGTPLAVPLGACILAATLAAALAVHPRSAYVLIPVPALAYLAAVAAAGLATGHGPAAHPALAVTVTQWAASGFPTMAAATAVAIIVTTARWSVARRTPRAGRGADQAGQPARTVAARRRRQQPS